MKHIKDQRLFYNIADDIKKKIEQGIYAIGVRLPAEAKMAEQYNVSRAVIREAVLYLEIQGYVEARVGAGVYIVENQQLQQEQTIMTEDAGPFEIMQARLLIESEVAALAAKRITLKGLKKIRKILDDEASLDISKREHTERYEADRAFHLAVAEACDNNTLFLIVKNLWQLRSQNPLWEKLNEHLAFTKDDWKEAQKNHEKIYLALAQKSPELAKEAMGNHLNIIRNLLLKLTQFDECLDDSSFFDD